MSIVSHCAALRTASLHTLVVGQCVPAAKQARKQVIWADNLSEAQQKPPEALQLRLPNRPQRRLERCHRQPFERTFRTFPDGTCNHAFWPGNMRSKLTMQVHERELSMRKRLGNFLCCKCELASGSHAWQLVLLPRIRINLTESKKIKKSHPVHPFAMTINQEPGADLLQSGHVPTVPCYSHGHIYVAMSRVESPDGMLAFVLRNNIEIGPPNSQLCSVNKTPLLGQPCTAKPTVNLQTNHTLARRLDARMSGTEWIGAEHSAAQCSIVKRNSQLLINIWWPDPSIRESV
eukprot:364639-Chlamydomonas_euryale.AAC.8